MAGAGGFEGNARKKTHVRRNFEDNFEGDWKDYSGLSHEELMKSIRMVIAAFLLAIPFPHSLFDGFISMTCLGPWFSRE